MKGKHILLGCGIAFVVFVIGAAGLVFWAGRMVKTFTSRSSAPAQIKHGGVLKGSGLLSKTVFLGNAALGNVTCVASGTFDRRRGPEVGIAGSDGAAFVDNKSAVKAFQPFANSLGNVQIVDVENDGNCEYLDRGSWGSPAQLISHTGKQIWQFGNGVDDACPGDINGDGKLEFAVGFNGGGGVSLVSTAGKEQWNQHDGNVWHVEMVDINGDGRLEIVHSNAGGQMTIRDTRGNIIQQGRTADYFSHFSLCHYPTSTSPAYCLLAGDHRVSLFDFNAATRVQFAAPNARMLGNAYGTPVKLQDRKPEYLAVVIDYGAENLSVLYLFDSHKAVVYEESIPERCQSIAAVRLGAGQSESILLGGNGKVYRYDFNASKP